MRAGNYKSGEELVFNLVGINDLNKVINGQVVLKLINSKGSTISMQKKEISLKAFGRENIPALIKLPDQSGGYLLVSEFTAENSEEKVKSRRYIRVGDLKKDSFFDIKPE